MCFSTYKYLPDPYQEKRSYSVDKRLKGKRGFLTSPGKVGKLPDATFAKEFIRVNGGGVGLSTAEKLRIKKEAKQKWIDRRGFLPTNPPKRHSGAGDLYGCFGAPFDSDDEDERPKTSRKIVKNKTIRPGTAGDVNAMRNMVIGVPKNGPPGAYGTTFSRVEYVASPYELEKVLEAKKNKKNREMFKELQKFVPCSHPKQTFDSQEHCDASKIYSIGKKALKPKRNKNDMLTGKELAELRMRELCLFVPPNPAKSGENGCFTAFPEALPDPINPQLVRVARNPDRSLPLNLQVVKINKKLIDRRPWKSVSNPKSLPVKSTAKRHYLATIKV